MQNPFTRIRFIKSLKPKQKKYIINQYLEIRGKLQPNFANLRLDFRRKIWLV